MGDIPNVSKLDPDKVLKYLLTEDHPEWRMLQRNPGFSEKWVVFFLKRTRPVPREAVEDIYYHKVFRKSYQVKLHLVRCKTSPPHVSISLVHTLRWVDLFWSLRLPYLPGAVRQKIEAQIIEILPRLAIGEQVSLARHAPRPLIRHLRLLAEPRVIQVLLKNYYFTYEDAIFMANYPKTVPTSLEALALNKKWFRYKEVKIALMRHKQMPKSHLLPVAKTMTDHDLRLLLRHPELPLFTRKLIHRILEERFCVITGQKPSPEDENGYLVIDETPTNQVQEPDNEDRSEP